MKWDLRFEGKLPPSPNARIHWRTRAQANAAWKARAAQAAWDAGIPRPLPRITISATIERRNLGVADEDNDRARLKPLVDGIVAAGVIPTDRRGYVVWGDVTEARGRPALTLHIEALEDGP